MDSEIVSAILGLVRNEEFIRLHKLTAHGPIDRDVFNCMTMPEGFVAEQVWEILAVLHRYVGYESRAFACEPVVGGWAAVPPPMAQMLQDLDIRCASEAPLSQAIAERSGTHLFLQPLIEEIVTALRRDGVVLDHENVRELLLFEREPQDDIEQLVVNSQKLFLDLDRYVSRPFERDLLTELHTRIAQGIEELTAIPRSFAWPYGTLRASHDSGIDSICAIGNSEGNYSGRHPILRMISLAFCMWTARPFPAWNALLEVALRRLLLLKSGYLPLVYIPYSRAHFDWEEGVIGPPVVSSAYARGILSSLEGADWTPHILDLLGLVEIELGMLERTVRRAQARDERLDSILARDPAMNFRQRQTLGEALRRPDATFTITRYCQTHAVVKGTARHDLFGLVNFGFFRCERHGKELVFSSCPDLMGLIENHTPFSLFTKQAKGPSAGFCKRSSISSLAVFVLSVAIGATF